MNVHFIAIGGSAMHNLAIALHIKGYNITGSDDEIFEPAKSRLAKYSLLPPVIGWNPKLINNSLDAVILGMHAKEDNPELIKAKKLGIKIFSYPEYLYEQSKNKTRIVIAGSHGKTTITAMILHALNFYNIDCDYMVGAMLDGFDVMVKLTAHNKIIILEGDEYLTSPIDKRPKFHLYRPDIALISGIAIDHINVFPNDDIYLDQFRTFINLISPGGSLVYNANDPQVASIVSNANKTLSLFPYSLPAYTIDNGITRIILNDNIYNLQIFGQHNLSNSEGARIICNLLGIDDNQFYLSLATFKGASKRLEIIAQTINSVFFRDFAHSPSKLLATILAVKNQFPNRKLVACFELHTFSSLNKEFLPRYKDTLNSADIPIVYYSPHALQLKRLPPVNPQDIIKAFNNPNIIIATNPDDLKQILTSIEWQNKNLLMMSSGNFDNLNILQTLNL
ncbi:MAG: peptidoglycan synthetase [Bacteroidales bacterium]|nr:peptidoglycan synthetase [Bacteroidales bacterium]